MAKVIHKIKSYEITGTVKDNGWLYANRELLESHLREDMRVNNVLPILDMPTEVSCSYNKELDMFEFTMKAAGCEMENVANYTGILIADGIIVDANSKKVMFCDGL